MIRYFCSSDIHSFFDVWMLALKNRGFDFDNKDHKIVVCGDLWDRGNQSLECFEFVKRMAEENRLVYIKGNHEDLLNQCVTDLNRRRNISNHHVTNGTVRTIANFMSCSEYDILCYCYDNKEFNSVMSEIIDFVNKNSVDYFELGDKVFVHGWVPETVDEENHIIVHSNWRDGDWRDARWRCGFDSWRCKLLPPDKKYVVCGHWHTSYGWAKFRGRSEWGPDAEFTPFIDDGIIAVDACTAYTKMVNVVVFDEHGNLLKE